MPVRGLYYVRNGLAEEEDAVRGYHGKLSIVDLSTWTSKTEALDESSLRAYIGGSGLGAFLLTRFVSPGTDPLGAENALIFSVGPFCGTAVPTSGRHQLTSLSPLTGIFAEADVGGRWGYAFQATGFDALVIRGASDRPVSILVSDCELRFEEASSIWGRDTFEVDEYFKRRFPKSETACIGEAGEKLVRIASVMHDGRHARAAGRCGLGAVMGSKKLKAVAAIASGSIRKSLFDEAGLKASAAAMAAELPRKALILSNFGTVGTIGGAQALGDVPVKNWRLGSFGDATAGLSGQRLAESGRLVGKYFCKQCSIGCGRSIELSDGKPGAGPEYETACMYGANCLVADMEAVIKANESANRLGIDTISSGAAIAYLMEAYERGELKGLDLGGIAPEWGRGEVLIELVGLIGRRRGIGEILGEGVARASLQFGDASYAIHTKGLEYPAHDPRAFGSMALSYATGNRGACHLQGLTYNFEKVLTMPERGFDLPQDRFGSERKAELVMRSQDLMCLLDSLKLCKFALFGGMHAQDALGWLRAITGWDMGMEEFLRAGERIFNVKRCFNAALGLTRKDDTVPARIAREPKGGGTNDYLPPSLEESLDEYYRRRGWSEDGVPGRDKLAELGIQ
jgi:aldehyde:ferredoxin oxidoreductase